MGILRKAFLFVFAVIAPALAQSRLGTTPSAAGSGPAYDVSVGCTYLGMAIPGSGLVNFYGLDGSGRVDFSRRWGAMLDSSYVRASNVLDTGRGGYVLSLLGGPVFYPFERGNSRMFVRALAGAGLVNSAAPESANDYLYGWVAHYSYAVGGGVERSVLGPFAIRVGADYLRTAFVDSAAVAQPRSNLRATVSFIYRLKERQH